LCRDCTYEYSTVYAVVCKRQNSLTRGAEYFFCLVLKSFDSRLATLMPTLSQSNAGQLKYLSLGSGKLHKDKLCTVQVLLQFFKNKYSSQLLTNVVLKGVFENNSQC
jgi:hypothetical protein